MLARLQSLVSTAEAEIRQAIDPSAVEALRVKYLGKKGELAGVLRGMGQVPAEERPAMGAAVNSARDKIEALLLEARTAADGAAEARELEASKVDVTQPGRRHFRGARHPVTRAMEEMVAILERMGFAVASGPEAEDDFHNFEALNFPPDHPARDMQDTFYLDGGALLRTHTSPVQVRVMQSQKPPVRVVCPGKVFRSDADVTHSPMFHQIEGLFVDGGVTFADLKGTLTAFAHGYFGPDAKVRLRPSYFPFVEPGAEMDFSCILCNGKGRLAGGAPCRVCKTTGWLEVGGAGMVHPNVFRACGYDPAAVTGFAFGWGVDRLAMLKHAVGDIRYLFENDMRFLEQLS